MDSANSKNDILRLLVPFSFLFFSIKNSFFFKVEPVSVDDLERTLIWNRGILIENIEPLLIGWEYVDHRFETRINPLLKNARFTNGISVAFHFHDSNLQSHDFISFDLMTATLDDQGFTEFLLFNSVIK